MPKVTDIGTSHINNNPIIIIIMKLEINNKLFKHEACEIFKRICCLTDIEVAANIATSVCHSLDDSGTLKIYRGGNHIALLSKDIFASTGFVQVAIFTA